MESTPSSSIKRKGSHLDSLIESNWFPPVVVAAFASAGFLYGTRKHLKAMADEAIKGLTTSNVQHTASNYKWWEKIAGLNQPTLKPSSAAARALGVATVLSFTVTCAAVFTVSKATGLDSVS